MNMWNNSDVKREKQAFVKSLLLTKEGWTLGNRDVLTPLCISATATESGEADIFHKSASVAILTEIFSSL